MKLSSLKFTLPKELIAKHPLEERDQCRLMVVDKKSGKIEHKIFKDIVNYFDEGDSLILNDTKLFPARIIGQKEKTKAKIEVLLLRELNSNDHQWDALVDPARKIRVGNKLFFGNSDLVAEVSDNTTSRGRTLKFLFDGTTMELYKLLNKLGQAPIPTKILERNPLAKDIQNYQTVYAKNIGGVVPPEAGLHFTKYLLKNCELHGIEISFLTIHTGLGAHNIIDVEDIVKYRINSESFTIPSITADKINESLKNKKKICAVGCSVMKAIESSISSYNTVKPLESGWTNKFIKPSDTLKVTNSLIENFYMPKSVMFVNTAAMLGEELTMEVYSEAIKEKYRFFVYGDAMLVK